MPWDRVERAWCLLALLVLAVGSCSSDQVAIPDFAVGVVGPAVLDPSGVVAGWRVIGGPDEEMVAYEPGLYVDDFGVFQATADSTELIVVWSAVPCQTEPVAQVTTPAGELRIVVTPGPNAEEHCAAMAIHYGFVLTLRQPLGNRSVTADLVDPAAQRIVDFP